MTEPTEAEIEAGAAAIRWLEDEAINSVEVARDVLTAAAQVRERAGNAEIERLRRLLVSIQDHPDTPKLFSAVIQNELARPAEKPALMPIYSATEDQG